MGALGNGRRVGRSPPLLIAALTTCILVLAFNYWVSNSRIAELQAQVYELEAHVRRGDAEREEVSEKWGEAEATMKRQTMQIRELEEQHQRQETTLHLNVSSCSKTVLDMKSQLKSLSAELGKAQQELLTCQGSVNTLNKKLTYDTAQCNTQMLALKEDCEERMAAVKEAQKKQEKNGQTNAADTLKVSPVTVGNQKVVAEDPANQTVEKSPKPTQPAESPDVTELKTNEIVGVHDGTAATPKTPASAAAAVKDSVIGPELGGGGALSVIGQKEEQEPPKATADPDAAQAAKLSLTGVEDALMPGEGPVEYTDQTEADQTETDNTEKDALDNIEDYEEDNEPEQEDDKQAALALN